MNVDDHRRVLVAGIGNVFLGDDGFGVEVVNRMDATALPAAVDVLRDPQRPSRLRAARRPLPHVDHG